MLTHTNCVICLKQMKSNEYCNKVEDAVDKLQHKVAWWICTFDLELVSKVVKQAEHSHWRFGLMHPTCLSKIQIDKVISDSYAAKDCFYFNHSPLYMDKPTGHELAEALKDDLA